MHGFDVSQVAFGDALVLLSDVVQVFGCGRGRHSGQWLMKLLELGTIVPLSLAATIGVVAIELAAREGREALTR